MSILDMKLTSRDRWLLAILPALLAAIVYIFAVNRPQGDALRDLGDRLAASRAQAVPAERIQAQRAELRQVRGAVASKRSGIAAGRPADPRRYGTPADRPASLAALSGLLETRQVVVAGMAKLADADAKATGAHGALPARAAAEKETQPELWKLDLVCEYSQILDVLRAIPQLAPVIVPMRLSMDAAESDSPLRRWSLVVAL